MSKIVKSTSANMRKNWFQKPGADHITQFYDYESRLLEPLSEFVISGLNHGDTCIVIATTDHLNKLEGLINGFGGRVPPGQYIPLDAAVILNSITENNQLSRKKFMEIVGGLITKAEKRGRPMRVFGEIVAILWQQSKKTSVLELERLWNDLARRHQFSLYCAYPMIQFDRTIHSFELEEIHKLHSHTTPTFSNNRLLDMVT